MNTGLLAGVVRARAELRSHDRWSRDELIQAPLAAERAAVAPASISARVCEAAATARGG